MITHMVLVRLADPTKTGTVTEQLRSLGRCDSVRGILVTEDLGLAPTTWDLCVMTQHRDADELAQFRRDEFHREVSASIAAYVEAAASVDADTAGRFLL